MMHNHRALTCKTVIMAKMLKIKEKNKDKLLRDFDLLLTKLSGKYFNGE